uniref:Uncharacterized protein n=1 Tax=Anguilla anguilla TaxID=7936 RepID=A0A0E9WF34_ANGAN
MLEIEICIGVNRVCDPSFFLSSICPFTLFALVISTAKRVVSLSLPLPSANSLINDSTLLV